MAPSNIASALFAAANASAVIGMPCALIEHCGPLRYDRVFGKVQMLTPPSRCSWKLNLMSGFAFSMTFTIL